MPHHAHHITALRQVNPLPRSTHQQSRTGTEYCEQLLHTRIVTVSAAQGKRKACRARPRQKEKSKESEIIHHID